MTLLLLAMQDPQDKPRRIERELYELRPSLLRAARRSLVTLDDSEDAVQEASMRLLRSADRFDGDRPFEPWAYRVLLNVIRDVLRRQRRDSAKVVPMAPILIDGDDDPVEWIVRAPDADGPEALLLRSELSEPMQAALACLPDEYRKAVVLAAQGHSYEEIARILGRPLGTVRSRIHRGRTLLRRAYRGEGN